MRGGPRPPRLLLALGWCRAWWAASAQDAGDPTGNVTRPPCPKECQCGVSPKTVEPCAPMTLMDCKVVLQGIEVDVLFPELRHPGQDHIPIFDTVPRELNPGLDDRGPGYPKFAGLFGDASYPFASWYGFRPGSLVLDIGANAGLFALVLSSMYPDIRIVSLEPVPWLAGLVRENLRRNGIPEGRVDVHTAALTGNGRNVTIHEQSFELEGSNIYGGEWGNYSGSVQIPSFTLAQLMAMARPSEELAFVKTDCEGCEYEALEQFAEVKVPFVLACHAHEENQPWVAKDLMRRCFEIAGTGAPSLTRHRAGQGCPVALAALALQTSAVDRPAYLQVLRRAVEAGSDQKAAVEKLPEGPARAQYAALFAIYRKLTTFYLALELESGEALPVDWRAAAALFETAGTFPLATGSVEGDRLSMWPPMAWITSGSMFRLGEMLNQGGHGLAQDKAAALTWWRRAAALGHALAQAREQAAGGAQAPPKSDASGYASGTVLDQLYTSVQMEALGVPRALGQVALGVAGTGGPLDECIAKDQLANMPAWEEGAKEKGQSFDHMHAHRFRSWLRSAMHCWI